MIGMHGTKASNFGVTDCDLLIVIGARFSDRVVGKVSKFAENAKILQIDVDPAEVNKNVMVDASIIGDVKEVLKRLLPKLDENAHEDWVKHIEEYENKFPLKYDPAGLTGPYVVKELYRITKGDA